MARRTDPWTSKQAKLSVKNSPDKAKAILKMLRSGMTDEQMVELYTALALNNEVPWASPSGLRTLRNSLWKDGKIKDTNKVALTQSGRNAIVWKKS